VPRERLQEDYLVKLMEAQTFSAVVLDSFRSNGATPMCKSWKRVVADRLILLSMSRRERRFRQAARNGERKALKFLSNGG
jgi:hypothetical protein